MLIHESAEHEDDKPRRLKEMALAKMEKCPTRCKFPHVRASIGRIRMGKLPVSRATIARTALFVLLPLFMVFTAFDVAAIGFALQGHISIAPVSIPIGPSGTAGIGVARLQFRNANSGDTNTSISGITVELTTDGAFDETDISRIRVYFEPQGGGGLFDNGDPGGNDVDVEDTGGPFSFDAGKTKSIPIDPTKNSFGWGASTHIFVVLDFGAGSDVSTNVGVYIKEIWYGAAGVGGGFAPAPPSQTFTDHTVRQNVDFYEVTLAATGLAPASADQGTEKVPVLKLDFDLANPPDDTSATADIDSIKVHAPTTVDADVTAGGIILFEDTNTNGSLDVGTDVELTSGTLSGGYVTLNPLANLQITSTGATFFVTASVATDATVSNTVELEIEDPSTDVVFSDEIDDGNVTIPAEYVYVPLLYPYTQLGYIVSSAATPTTNNSFTITEFIGPDVTPPAVTLTIPSDSAVDVAIDAEIVATFSEAMNPATISGSNFSLVRQGGGSITGTVAYASSTLRFTPNNPLSYDTGYTATITTGAKDVAGNPLASNEVWSFTTTLQYPDFDEAIATNNRIVPGSTDPVRIFVPQPPQGAQDRVTVQVFTTTGKRVTTLVSGRPYQDIAGSLPILWDGTNGRNQRLGPGLYFVQIRATGYKRVLKVLIVR
jgi:hypothetical protein